MFGPMKRKVSLLLAAADGHLSIWNLAGHRRELDLASGLASGVHAFFVSAERLVAIDQKGKIRLYDRRSGQLLDAFFV